MSFIATRIPFQNPIRRLIVRSRKVSKPTDLYLELYDRFKFDRYLGYSAADLHVKFQGDVVI